MISVELPNRARRNGRPGLPPAVLLVGYLIIILVPLALAAAYEPRGRFLYRELAAGLALVGFAILFMQFVLSGRFEMIAGRLGIDLLMRFHQLLARTAAVFLVLHAVLYLVPLIGTERRTGRGRLLGTVAMPELAAGVVALVLLLLLVFLAIRRRRLPIRYEAWRALHGLFGAAVVILGTYHALGLGRYSQHAPLAALWISLLVVALGSILYVYLVKPLLLLRRPYRVASNRPVGTGLWEVTVEPDGAHRLSFAAGQFAWVNFRRYPLSLLDHPFSIASAPEQLPRMAFLIKESGDFTNHIGALAPGHPAYLDAPHGAFTLFGREGEGIALIAGGVGIAPILSLLRHLRATHDPRPVRLLYGAGRREQLVYTNEIERIQGDIDLKAEFVLAEPPPGWEGRSGTLNTEIVQTWVDFEYPERWLFFLCGPPLMMEAVEDTLHSLGVPLRHIVYERFTFD